MNQTRRIGIVLLVCASLALGSWPCGVYARIDKVVFEPVAGAPQRVQIWGAFSVFLPESSDALPRDSYSPAAKGYLYFSLPEKTADNARREWADLRRVAGTGQIVAFAARNGISPKLRAPARKPENPDVYQAANIGVVKVENMDTYPPVRSILAIK